MTNIVTLAPKTSEEIAGEINERVAETMRDFGMVQDQLKQIVGERGYAYMPLPGFHRLSADLFYALAKPGTVREIVNKLTGESFKIAEGHNDLMLYSDEAVTDHDLRSETCGEEWFNATEYAYYFYIPGSVNVWERIVNRE